MQRNIKLQKFGHAIEILIDYNKYNDYKNGKVNINDIVLSDNIFKSIQHSERASQTIIDTICGEGKSHKQVLEYILKHGHVQLTVIDKNNINKQKKQDLLNYIIENYTSPKEKLTINKLEEKIKNKKIVIDYQKNIHDLSEFIISKLDMDIKKISSQVTLRLNIVHIDRIKKIFNKFLKKYNIQKLGEEAILEGVILENLKQEFIIAINKELKDEQYDFVI